MPFNVEAMRCIQTPEGNTNTYTNYIFQYPQANFTVQRGDVEYEYSFGVLGDGREGATFSALGSPAYASYYSDAGDISAVVDPLGAGRTAFYNHMGLPLSVGALPGSRVSSMTYDDNGRMLTHTNPPGQTVSQTFLMSMAIVCRFRMPSGGTRISLLFLETAARGSFKQENGRAWWGDPVRIQQLGRAIPGDHAHGPGYAILLER